MLNVTFYGVRGSTPCSGEATRRYGGNTSCVAVEAPGQDPVIFDLGTGLRHFGETLRVDESFRATALVTHHHWDHVQGLPFFLPVLCAGARLDIYGPPQPDRSVADCFCQLVQPPYFPVSVDELPADIAFHDVSEAELAVGDAKVKVRRVPHTGPTNGYRMELDGMVVTYVSDHQMPADGTTISDAVLELSESADLLIHDAQYSDAEYAAKSTWGHSTAGYAVEVAARAGARRLVLFHHDPSHDDDEVDAMLAAARRRARGRIDEVIAAHEGLTIVLG